MSVEKYTREFEKLVIKCDLQKAEDQTIVRYLGGRDPMYTTVVELQQYSTFNEVCVLSHKVKQQRRTKTYERDFPRPLPKSQPFNMGSSFPQPKPTAISPSTPQKPKLHQKS